MQHSSDADQPLTPPEVADLLRTLELRCGYIIGTCKDTHEMRLEAEEMKRLLDRAFKGLRAWWHSPPPPSREAISWQQQAYMRLGFVRDSMTPERVSIVQDFIEDSMKEPK